MIFQAKEIQPRGWRASIRAEQGRLSHTTVLWNRLSLLTGSGRWLDVHAVCRHVTILLIICFLFIVALRSRRRRLVRRRQPARVGLESASESVAISDGASGAALVATISADQRREIIKITSESTRQRVPPLREDEPGYTEEHPKQNREQQRSRPSGPDTTAHRSTASTLSTSSTSSACLVTRRNVDETHEGSDCVSGTMVGGTPLGDSVRNRVQEAKYTLSSIHAELPPDMPASDKLAMTHMMLEAIKVNESCKATSSMHRMENIAEQGNDIQSELCSMKHSKHRTEDVSRRAIDLQKTMVDVICVGTLCMVCTVIYLMVGCRAGSGIGRSSVALVAEFADSCTPAQRGILSPRWSTFLSHPSGTIFSLWCYAASAIRLLQAGIVMVVTPVVISKLGIFQIGVQTLNEAPVFKLATTFSLVCGASGWYAVNWLGGNSGLWLAMWQGWVWACILCLSSATSIIKRLDERVSRTAGVGMTAVNVCLWTLGGVVYPVSMGLLPFVLP
jgi:hypothetical protein